MNPLASAWTILGTVVTFLTFGALKTAPDTSEGILEAPVGYVYEAIPYGEVPVAALAAPTTSSTTTTVWLEPAPKTECEEALQIALDVGWPASEMATLARVLWRESRCSQGPVLNPEDPYGGSYGLMQINGWWCQVRPGRPVPWLQQRKLIKECVDLYGAEPNLRAGLAIWKNSGWHPWGIK